MNTSGRSRGSAWWARWSRASSESTVTGPTLRGRQCSTPTCTTHSITGNSASSPTGSSSSNQLPPPTSTRAVTAASSEVAISHGLGWRQNCAPRTAERQAAARAAWPVIRASSAASRSPASFSISGVGRVMRRRPLRRSARARRGRPPGSRWRAAARGRPRRGRSRGRRRRSPRRAAGRPHLADLLGHERRQRLERGLVGRAQAVEHQLEHQRVGGGDDGVPERERVLLPLDVVVGGGEQRRGCRRATRRARRRRARPPAPRPPARRRAAPRARCGRRRCRAGRVRTSSRGSRSRPAERAKSRTVVAPPCRTSTSRVCAIRCSASRTAGRETPSTSASRRSLGSGSPARDLAVHHLGEHLVEDVVGDRAAGDRGQWHGDDGRWLLVRGQVVRPVLVSVR